MTNPADVISWFDEVQERQAFDSILVTDPGKRPLDNSADLNENPAPLQAQP